MNDNLKFSVKVNTSNNYWMTFALILFSLFSSSLSFANSNKSLSQNKKALFHDKTWNNSEPFSKETLFIENPNLITGWGNIVISDKVNKTVKKEKTPQKLIQNGVVFFNDSIVITGLENIHILSDKKEIKKKQSISFERNNLAIKYKNDCIEKKFKKTVNNQKIYKSQSSKSSVFYSEYQKQNSIINTSSKSFSLLNDKVRNCDTDVHIYTNYFQKNSLFGGLSFLEIKKSRAPPTFFIIHFESLSCGFVLQTMT